MASAMPSVIFKYRGVCEIDYGRDDIRILLGGHSCVAFGAAAWFPQHSRSVFLLLPQRRQFNAALLLSATLITIHHF